VIGTLTRCLLFCVVAASVIWDADTVLADVQRLWLIVLEVASVGDVCACD
jgi:hypothetical protein